MRDPATKERWTEPKEWHPRFVRDQAGDGAAAWLSVFTHNQSEQLLALDKPSFNSLQLLEFHQQKDSQCRPDTFLSCYFHCFHISCSSPCPEFDFLLLLQNPSHMFPPVSWWIRKRLSLWYQLEKELISKKEIPLLPLVCLLCVSTFRSCLSSHVVQTPWVLFLGDIISQQTSCSSGFCSHSTPSSWIFPEVQEL